MAIDVQGDVAIYVVNVETVSEKSTVGFVIWPHELILCLLAYLMLPLNCSGSRVYEAHFESETRPSCHPLSAYF